MGRERALGWSTEQSLGLFSNDLFAANYFVLPLPQRLIGDGLQVIDIVQKYIRHKVHLRFDISWDRNID